MVTKIEINTFFGELLFSFEKEDNSIKSTIEEAVKRGANLHGADLRGADLGDAYLRGADLGGANLGNANLRGANLGNANLGGANLRGANLGGADLGGANLGNAYLGGADLGGANLHGADLHGADLCGADLGDAYLRGADLRNANLRGAKNVPFIPLACPSDGAFVGWKKVKSADEYLVKLEIPEDARRSSATSNKCRCDKAKVLAITDLEENDTFSEVTNREYAPCTYKVGEFVYPDSFDEDRWKECSHGIHFFINKQEAINY